MTRQQFPALGFDPAPGDPAAVESSAQGVDRAGRMFGAASGSVTRLHSSDWTGDAADAFRGQLADLPRDLDLAARTHQSTARALRDYGTGLATRQRRADELETRAAELRRRQQAAIAEVNQLAARTAPEGSPELAALKSTYDAVLTRANGLGTELSEVIAQARRLHGDHVAAAGSAAATIRAQADAPYEQPGWLSRARDSVKGWITKHADLLEHVSGDLKAMSLQIGLLSMIPGLQFLAPIAIALGGIALALDIAVKAATGKGSWTDMATDAAVTFLPVGKVARLVKKVPGVEDYFSFLGRKMFGMGLKAGRPRFGVPKPFTDAKGYLGERGTSVRAYISPHRLPPGGVGHRRPPESVRVAGFDADEPRHAVGQLLPGDLGGSHEKAENLVTLVLPAGKHIGNGPKADFDDRVRRVVEGSEPGVPQQGVVYLASATGKREIPDSLDLFAIGDEGWTRQVRIPNG